MTEPTAVDLEADRALLLEHLDLLAARTRDDAIFAWSSTIRAIRTAVAKHQDRRAERLGWEVSDAMTEACRLGSGIHSGSPFEMAMHHVPDVVDPVVNHYVRRRWREDIEAEVEDMRTGKDPWR